MSIQRWLPILLSGLIGLAACSRKAEDKPSLQSSVGDQDKLPPTPVVPASPLDLGGPCSETPQTRLALTGKQEADLRKAKNWNALIEGAKQNVRDLCSNAYRWGNLFNAFVDAHRYTEATQVLNEMKTRGFPLPFATLSKADSGFLSGEEFRRSSLGLEFEARSREVAETMRRAESSLSSMDAKDLPPSLYTEKGACPFECCTYRKWKTTKPVQLLESIRSSKVVATIAAGVSVQALTGQVDVEPVPYVALEDLGVLKAGDVIFFLNNLGEGYVNYWYNGKLKPELGLDDGLLFYTYENCTQNSGPGSCSLRKLHPEKEYRNEWWVHLRTANGKEGWVLNTGQFDNMDACG